MLNIVSSEAIHPQQSFDLPSHDVVGTCPRRALAIASGALLDVSDTAREAGFIYPLAMTAAAWASCVEWSIVDSQRQQYQDEPTRLWFLLLRAHTAIRCSHVPQATLYFKFYRLAKNGVDQVATPCELKLTCSTGDAGEPVVTLQLAEES